MDDSYGVWWNSNHALLRRTHKFMWLSLNPPPPPMGPPWTLPRSIFILHLHVPVYIHMYMCNSSGKESYLTVLVLELDREEQCIHGPWGPPPGPPRGHIYTRIHVHTHCTPWTTLHSLLLRIISATFGYSLTMGFEEIDLKQLFSMAPPPHYPLMDPIGPPPELHVLIICILHLHFL